MYVESVGEISSSILPAMTPARAPKSTREGARAPLGKSAKDPGFSQRFDGAEFPYRHDVLINCVGNRISMQVACYAMFGCLCAM